MDRKFTTKTTIMNWGIKIIAAYLFFVAGIMALVVKSMNQEHELVVNDYYAQELKYQDKLDAAKRTTQLNAPVNIKYSANQLNIEFPDDSNCKDIHGNIHIYCASDRAKDNSGTFNLKEGLRLIHYPYQGYGTRKIEISWTKNGLTYFAEKEIFLP